jgi:hypothetical protein
MNRRLFLASMVAVGGSLMLRRSTLGQSLPPATQPASSGDQAQAIRTTASQFLQTLSPDHRTQVTYAFPTGESPVAARFARNGGPGGGPRGGGGPGDRGGPGGGPGMGLGGFAFVGEKFGQAVWSNFPVSDVPRPGVQMGAFTSAERDSAHALLRSVLSPMGYQKVLDIMAPHGCSNSAATISA